MQAGAAYGTLLHPAHTQFPLGTAHGAATKAKGRLAAALGRVIDTIDDQNRCVTPISSATFFAASLRRSPLDLAMS
jgi:hypothetical protein